MDNNQLKLNDKYLFDTANKTFQYFEHDKTYTMYYKEAYIHAITVSTYEAAEFYYYIDTGQLNCSGSNERSCSDENLNKTKQTIDVMNTYFSNYLGREYTVEDI